MAQVKINIPGIGEVVAEGAASEETLNKLLAAMSKSEKTKRQEEVKAAQEVKKAKEEEAKQAKAAADQLNRLTEAERKALQDQEAKKRAAQEFTNALVEGATNIGSAIGTTVTSLAKSAVSVAAQLATSYNTLTNDPIGAAAGMLNTGIDMAGTAARGLSEVIGGIGKALSGIPIVGPIIGGVLGAIDGAGKGIAEAGVQAAKIANNIFAEEFKKTARVLSEFTRVGASFAGGMDEMRVVSHSSGLSMDTFSKAAINASDAMRSAGFSQGEGAMALAGVMRAASKITNEGGHSLQKQMIALGVGLEDQGRLMAEVMAQDRLAGRERRMTDEEVAKRTKDYAIDLKVLADITGKNAQEAMRQAQIKSMEADILASLGDDPEAIAKFQAALASTPDSLKKGYLEFVATGGTAVVDSATAVMLAQSPALAENFRKITDDIRNSAVPSADFGKEILKSYASIGQDIRKSMDTTMNLAARLGATGAIAGVAEITNELIRRGIILPEEVDKSAKAARAMTENITGTSDAFARIITQAEGFKKSMESLVAAKLPDYAQLLASTFETTTKTFLEGVENIRRMIGLAPPIETTRAGAPPPVTGEAGRAAVAAATGRDLSSISIEEGEAQAARMSIQNRLEMINASRAGRRTPDANFVDQGLSFARGGVAAGPLTGFRAMLHGVEAVVPLDGGRSIPVSVSAPTAPSQAEIDMQNNITVMAEAQTRLVELMQNFVEKQDESNRHLEDASHNMSRLLQATA